MRSSILGSVLLGIGGVFLAAAAAQADHLSRPDLLQVDDKFVDTRQPSGVDSGWASLQMSGSTTIEGTIGITVTDGDSSAGFSGAIEDFDKAAKTPYQATLSNKAHTYMTAWTYDGTSTSSTSEKLEDCHLLIAARDGDNDGSADSAVWNLGCKGDALSRVGLSQSAEDRLLEIFETVKPKGVVPKALKYVGKGILAE